MRPPDPATRAALSMGALTVVLCACAQGPTRGPVGAATASAPACADFSFPIYFQTASDQLTASARQVVDDAARRMRGCRIGRIEVVGLADADGSARTNLALSRRRADTVAQALSAGGLPRPEFDIDAIGESGAVTPSGRPEPLRRRTEVVIHAEPGR